MLKISFLLSFKLDILSAFFSLSSGVLDRSSISLLTNSSFSLNSSPSSTFALRLGFANIGVEDYSVFIRPSVSYQSTKIFNNTVGKIYRDYGGADLFQGKYSQVNMVQMEISNFIFHFYLQ